MDGKRLSGDLFGILPYPPLPPLMFDVWELRDRELFDEIRVLLSRVASDSMGTLLRTASLRSLMLTVGVAMDRFTLFAAICWIPLNFVVSSDIR
jgi:hypothetical protein